MTWALPTEVESLSYEVATNRTRWNFPENFNAARDILRRDQPSDAPAILHEVSDGTRETFSFEELDELSGRIASGLAHRGVSFGDRIAIASPQGPRTIAIHLAAWKSGAISVPLSALFGRDALRYRLRDSGAKALFAHSDILKDVRQVSEDCPDLESIVTIEDDPIDEEIGMTELTDDGNPDYPIAETRAETPAIILYTSGSTGPPKGVIHRHELWPGSIPAFYSFFEGFPSRDDIFWTPADWAWIGSLANVVVPALQFGRPVVSSRQTEFTPQRAREIIRDFHVSKAFLPPTALRMMRSDGFEIRSEDFPLSVVVSGGEPVSPSLLSWTTTSLPSVTVNEVYGQTEAHSVIATSQRFFDQRPGKVGKPVIGQEVAILDQETGIPCDPGELGEIAVAFEDNPVVSSEYWNGPNTIEESRHRRWHVTGDLGIMDEDGYIEFKSRADDLIVTSGYRIGPTEIEATLMSHRAVDEACVVGLPHETRHEVVAAYVELADKRSSS